jgi:hypothetical protein
MAGFAIAASDAGRSASAPEAARPLIATPDIAAVIDLLEKPDASLGTDPRETRNSVLLESLSAAVNELRQLLGPDPNDRKRCFRPLEPLA